MMKTLPQGLSHPHRLTNRLFATIWVAGAALFYSIKSEGQTVVTFDVAHPASASGQLQQQHLVQLFQERLKDDRPEAVDRVRNDFLDYLRRGSPLASEKLLNGKMDDEELSSRVDVFLRDRPPLMDAATHVANNEPRELVAALLRNEPAIAGTEPERLVLADRFLERLGQRSPTARNELLRGKMAPEELQSRVSVFIADLRAEANATPVDTKTAAVQALVDSYIKANFGERANDIVYKFEIEANGVKRQGMIFRKRPGKIRMHIVEDGLVIGVLAFDGTTAWRQEPGKAGVPSTGAEVESLKQLARFDDPLIDFRERGTEVKLVEKPDKGPFQLHIRETDGTEMIAAIDPVTYNEISLRTRQSDGKWRETRFSDYRKLGTFNLAYVQEDWSEGKVHSATRISEARIDSGLIDQFFVRPLNPILSYMDYMGGLAAIKAQQKQQPSVLNQSIGGSR
jgi:hypothetical protein